MVPKTAWPWTHCCLNGEMVEPRAMMAPLYFLKQVRQFFFNLIDKISIGVWILLLLMSPIAIQYTIGDSSPLLVSVIPVLITWWICHYKLPIHPVAS